MKYIKEYMVEELGLQPGDVALEEVLEVSWSDYAMYLEKKYDELKSRKR